MDIKQPATGSQRRSVLPIFGENLRMLTASRGSQTQVAADLNISRVQFQRYLRSESFPKPNVLQRICEYFGVDARILTEPVSEALLDDMQMARVHANFPHRSAWLAMLDFCAPKTDFVGDYDALEPGLYVAWQWCGARTNTIIRRRFMVYRKDETTVFRGYAPREFFSPGTPMKQREYRGLCLNLKTQGHVLISFSAKPSAMIGMIYVTPMTLEMNSSVMIGYSAISRDELPGMPRLSRIVIQRIGNDSASLVREAHTPNFYVLEDIPKGFGDLLGAPLG